MTSQTAARLPFTPILTFRTIKGTADLAMPSLSSDGGVYLLLPGGEDGALSKHPKAGVKQMSFGEMIPSLNRLNMVQKMFESGQLKAYVDHIFDFDQIGAVRLPFLLFVNVLLVCARGTPEGAHPPPPALLRHPQCTHC